MTAPPEAPAEDKLMAHKQYIERYGEDLPEIRQWKWGAARRDRV
jgi:phosphoketolase